MPSNHATLGPSGAARWINCTASVEMSKKVPKQGSSVFAQEGTFAHSLGEIEAGTAFGIIDFAEYGGQYSKWLADMKDEYPKDWQAKVEEMQGHIDGYVDLIRDHSRDIKAATIFLEQRVDTGVQGCWGTSDTVIVGSDTIEIIDLKYGMGVEVDAVHNYQLMLYALGACNKFSAIVEPEKVRMTVYQPRINHVSTWEVSYDFLVKWREEVAKPAAKEALSREGKFNPSLTACRWCPAAGICKPRADKVLAEDFGEDPTVITPDELGSLLGRLPEISKFIDDVKESALHRAYTLGEAIPGYKVVRSGGRRIINDQPIAIQTLIEKGYPAEKVSTVKIKGIGDLEKLVGKTELPEIIGSFITKTEGKPALAPVEDRRKAISREDSAKEDFGEV